MGVIAYRKDGQYGAPPGMLYMQDRERLEEEERLLKGKECGDSHAGESTRAFLCPYGSE